jgi:hypothetical protein
MLTFLIVVQKMMLAKSCDDAIQMLEATRNFGWLVWSTRATFSSVR